MEAYKIVQSEFQSTLPARGATVPANVSSGGAQGFQSTLPARGATFVINCRDRHAPHFNPRSPHGERLPFRLARDFRQIISIHAPRTGSDRLVAVQLSSGRISIHAPRTGSDTISDAPRGGGSIFQSTLPARGATPRLRQHRTSIWYFNPRSPHGERPNIFQVFEPGEEISIHAPRTGSDATYKCPDCGATIISIHAPRTGSDRRTSATRPSRTHFNPRSPHGERRRRIRPEGFCPRISIHAPRTGSDLRPPSELHRHKEFQSTLPARGATAWTTPSASGARFQSTLPARGATASGIALQELFANFNPRSPHGERPRFFASFLRSFHFNPRSPHGERPSIVLPLSA